MTGTNHIKEHIERCIEIYGPIDVDYAEAPNREGYEQMRADLMLAVGMLMAIGPCRISQIAAATLERFSPGTIEKVESEEKIGHYQPHAEMKTGGAWFDRDGNYMSPSPKFFAPLATRSAG